MVRYLETLDGRHQAELRLAGSEGQPRPRDQRAVGSGSGRKRAHTNGSGRNSMAAASGKWRRLYVQSLAMYIIHYSIYMRPGNQRLQLCLSLPGPGIAGREDWCSLSLSPILITVPCECMGV